MAFSRVGLVAVVSVGSAIVGAAVGKLAGVQTLDALGAPVHDPITALDESNLAFSVFGWSIIFAVVGTGIALAATAKRN